MRLIIIISIFFLSGCSSFSKRISNKINEKFSQKYNQNLNSYEAKVRSFFFTTILEKINLYEEDDYTLIQKVFTAQVSGTYGSIILIKSKKNEKYFQVLGEKKKSIKRIYLDKNSYDKKNFELILYKLQIKKINDIENLHKKKELVLNKPADVNYLEFKILRKEKKIKIKKILSFIEFGNEVSIPRSSSNE